MLDDFNLQTNLPLQRIFRDCISTFAFVFGHLAFYKSKINGNKENCFFLGNFIHQKFSIIPLNLLNQ